MSNRLAQETSPYLLQHAQNPVDWHPWGPEALARARSQGRPIFLSIGYSACHWCHVMAHESFEDPTIARLLNEHFVPIKVDREERPDLDQLYMEAVQMMQQHGGWPLSVFLTPGLEPFFGGTYWPPRSRGGMPGFDEVLMAVAEAWESRRGPLTKQAHELARLLRENDHTAGGAESSELSERLLIDAETALGRSFDAQDGGFGSAPKFPHPMAIRLLLRRWRRTGRDELAQMATITLDRMAAGGIYDHLGGGFHRYSTDARWLVPHFEKMLYDNALLAGCYLEAWQATGRPDYAQVVRETLDYLLRDMAGPEGGFSGSEDADSEGGEGAFYLWTPDEVREILGPQAAQRFCYVYDVTEPGNFEHRNILNRPKPIVQCARIFQGDAAAWEAELAESRRRLLEVRARRSRPARDDKVLTSWNSLAIESLAQAGAALGEPRYVDAAAAAAEFLLTRLRDPQGRLLHAWRQGRARFSAYLEDYAALANALIALYEARFQERWIDEALQLAEEMVRRFVDPEKGGFFLTASDHEPLVVRKKDVFDSSVPSGGALATTALLRLGKLCARDDYLATAQASLRASVGLMQQAPHVMGQMLLALDFHLGPVPELVFLGSDEPSATRTVLSELHRRHLPNKVAAFRDTRANDTYRSPALSAIFHGKRPLPTGPTLFVCERFTCQSPVSGTDAVLNTLAKL